MKKRMRGIYATGNMVVRKFNKCNLECKLMMFMAFFSSIYGYSVASTSEAAYIIGGYYTRDIIAEFKDGKWRQSGTLAKKRAWHGSINLGKDVMVIGGFSDDGR